MLCGLSGLCGLRWALLAADRYAAVRGHHTQPHAAAAERRVELTVESSLDHHRKVGADAAVDRAGFQLRRVALRHRHLDAAVARRDVESLAVPVVAREVDRQAAVGRLALELAANVPERHAAVARMEFGDALEVVDRDAAVV